MKTLTLTFFFLLTAIFCIGQTPNIITVDNNANSTADHTTFASAHDAAVDGDIIYLQSSPSSYGNITITKELTLVGKSHSEVNNTTTLGTVAVRASKVTLKGLRMSSINVYSPTFGVAITNFKMYECYGNLTLGSTNINYPISGADIRGNVLYGFLHNVSATQATITNNILAINSLRVYGPEQGFKMFDNVFRSTSGLTITNHTSTETLILFDNIFTFNYGATANLSLSGGPINLNNSITFNYNSSNQVNITGTSNFILNNILENTNPLFTNVNNTVSQSFAGSSSYIPAFRPEDDLTLQAGSPAQDLGVGSTAENPEKIGLFASGYDFKYLGFPSGVPNLDIVTYDGAVAKDGVINVTVKAKAN